MRFLMSGAKGEPRDVVRVARVAPDPYGRWIVGANYLPAVPGIAGGPEVASALARLAIHVGAFTIPSWDVTYRPIIAELRGGLPPEHRYLFDLFAPPPGAAPDIPAADELAARLAEAARAVDPELDPVDSLGRVRRPVHILHGRDDRLIDHAEAPKLRDALPPDTWSRVTITRLFGHSSEVPVPLLTALHEVPRFSSALSAVLEVP
jgi:pimeloyl-ACP methyl ester carboxylesterase